MIPAIRLALPPRLLPQVGIPPIEVSPGEATQSHRSERRADVRPDGALVLSPGRSGPVSGGDRPPAVEQVVHRRLARNPFATRDLGDERRQGLLSLPLTAIHSPGRISSTPRLCVETEVDPQLPGSAPPAHRSLHAAPRSSSSSSALTGINRRRPIRTAGRSPHRMQSYAADREIPSRSAASATVNVHRFSVTVLTSLPGLVSHTRPVQPARVRRSRSGRRRCSPLPR